jgi:hypothetical protein
MVEIGSDHCRVSRNHIADHVSVVRISASGALEFEGQSDGVGWFLRRHGFAVDIHIRVVAIV